MLKLLLKIKYNYAIIAFFFSCFGNGTTDFLLLEHYTIQLSHMS